MASREERRRGYAEPMASIKVAATQLDNESNRHVVPLWRNIVGIMIILLLLGSATIAVIAWSNLFADVDYANVNALVHAITWYSLACLVIHIIMWAGIMWMAKDVILSYETMTGFHASFAIFVMANIVTFALGLNFTRVYPSPDIGLVQVRVYYYALLVVVVTTFFMQFKALIDYCFNLWFATMTVLTIPASDAWTLLAEYNKRASAPLSQEEAEEAEYE